MKLLTPELLYTLAFTMGIGIIFFTLSLKIKKGSNYTKTSLEQFLYEEQQANLVTKKSLPEDICLQVDLAAIPYTPHLGCIKDYEEITCLAKFPMANLQGTDNLTLKKQFGINHLETLCDYEQHYIHFIKTLTEYGIKLHHEGFIEESIKALEYCVQIGCNLNNCYLYLIKNYGIIKDKNNLQELKKYLKVQPPLGKEVIALQLDAALQSINNQ